MYVSVMFLNSVCVGIPSYISFSYRIYSFRKELLTNMTDCSLSVIHLFVILFECYPPAYGETLYLDALVSGHCLLDNLENYLIDQYRTLYDMSFTNARNKPQLVNYEVSALLSTT